jgi:carbon starvation protein
LVGPVLAAQFGYLPGALWILIGCVLGGGVHDMVVLFASVRHKGQSLATIASKEIGRIVGGTAAISVLSDLGHVVDAACLYRHVPKMVSVV